MNSTINKSKTVNFADVAHGTLIFDKSDRVESLILELIDTKWVQRLRRISQTGNTKFVYMFAEHSRFGHCLGVAYLSSLLLKHLANQKNDILKEYGEAISAAAILHDIGHLAPGSHLAEHVWTSSESIVRHEQLTKRIIAEDPEIGLILDRRGSQIKQTAIDILTEAKDLPPWTVSLISGGGWNADRGNWSIVDSVMCAVTYGRYNVTALIDAFRLTDEGELVIQESRVDALTHFYVARNSMYRQVYQHRVLQTADSMTKALVRRIRSINPNDIFKDPVMDRILFKPGYQEDLSLEELFQIDEAWWQYHLNHWRQAKDSIIKDLALRLRDRNLLKTIHLDLDIEGELSSNSKKLIEEAQSECKKQGFDPDYYSVLIKEKDKHLGKVETPPRILRESGELVDVRTVEPLVSLLSEKSRLSKAWLAVPSEVKIALGKMR